ncbi:MAG: YIP1 family protein [Candidatus Hermodarchaeota archaeon]
MSAPRFCPNCSIQLPDDKQSKFCPNCGKNIYITPNIYSGHTTYQSGYQNLFSYQTKRPDQSRFPEEESGSLFERLVKVLFVPREGMSLVTRAPDYYGPILISCIFGFLTGISLFICLAKIAFSQSFLDSSLEFILDRFLLLIILILALGIIGLIISNVVYTFFWSFVLSTLIGGMTSLNKKDISVKRTFSIFGYSLVPFIIKGAVDIAYFLFIFNPRPIDPIWFLFFPFEVLVVFMTSTLIFSVWSIVLVNYGLATLDIEQNKRRMMCVMFFIARIIYR